MILNNLMYFTIAVLILVMIHEYGHFIVARLCGVKVKRFSFGFGKILARFYDKKGTEFVFSMIPLGGYIKMLDGEEEPISENEKHFAFNHKPTWVKLAIVLAGPLFNFILAFIAFWLVLIIGITSYAPVIEGVTPGSIAEIAGVLPNYEIIALNDSKVSSWREFEYALAPLIGSNQNIRLQLKSTRDASTMQAELPLEKLKLEGKRPNVLLSLGLQPFVPKILPIIGEVLADSPAEQAGLKAGDVIRSMNAVVINDWLGLLDIVKQNPDKKIAVEIRRNGHKQSLFVELGSSREEGQSIGFLGVRSTPITWPKNWIRVQRESPLLAMGKAFQQTLEITRATWISLVRFATGKLPMTEVSGPLGIAKGAGESAQIGFVYYLSFLALISISLGVINLLPIPLLDGGHAAYYLLEAVLRRPVSQSTKAASATVGFIVLLALMVLATTNDISRLLSK